MKIPMPPPPLDELLDRARRCGPERLIGLISRYGQFADPSARYLPWDQLRHRPPPEDLTHEEWWIVTKLARLSARRPTGLSDKAGRDLTYALTDATLRAVEDINRRASGRIAMTEQVTNPTTRDRYLVSSLIEEAITSSQLEGAATTRAVAKDMLRTGRPPHDRSERMIVNNYAAMRRLSELKDRDLTPELICDLHRTVTDGTLDDPRSAGCFQRPGDERVAVYASSDQRRPVFVPPPAEEIPRRIEELCRFANGHDDRYVPPVLRAITLHFMVGYIHPFEDGNGRTARGLFYWSMLREGFWLTEYISISRILCAAPSQYMRSYLHVQQDDSDLTYFHAYQLDVIARAVGHLESYLEQKMQEVRDFQRSMSVLPGVFNARQTALLERAVKDDAGHYTTLSHATSHDVTQETARKDLLELERYGLLSRRRAGHAYVWTPAAGIADSLRRL